MTNYDFRSLSPHDFERLSTDLLQAELGRTLESFTTGPDSGIDARLLRRDEAVVIQCKHYASSPFSSLLANIRKQERRRIDDLPSRTRYILTTSIGLTPKNKDRLLDALGSRCRSLADIYGKDDLNNLLAKNPAIEERHYKLWLTSTATLTGIMHAGIITDSISHLDDVRRRLSRYVPNASLDRAKEILNQHHFCIVSGIPGVGKTTLAEVLVAHLVDKDGFAPFRVNNRLEELRPIKDRSKKQVFYFDDFLGRTDLVHLDRNEDRHLVDLMHEVGSNDRWRLVLTTREYILNAAKRKYEAIHQFPSGFAQCIVDLADYTRRVKAQILYNHIYFSDLPKSHKLAVLQPPKSVPWLDDGTTFSYQDVIDHPNYIPRLIEFMTGQAYLDHQDAQEYVTDFRANLDNPRRIWEHAFRYQISEASQRLLLVLATLPPRVHEDDARECFLRFSHQRRLAHGTVTRADDWNEALKELDGSFVASSRTGGQIALQFHNPSVEDFIKEHLRRSHGDVDDLLASVTFFGQYASLWARCGERFSSPNSTFFDKVKDFVPGRCARVVSPVTGSVGLTPFEEQVRFIMHVAKETGRDVSDSATVAIESMGDLWRRRKGVKSAALELLLYWRREVGDVPMEPFLAARGLLLDVDEGDIEDFELGAAFINEFRNASAEECEYLAETFLEYWNWSDFYDLQSEDELAALIDVVELIGRVTSTDFRDLVETVNEKIVELTHKAEEELDYGPSKWAHDDEPVREGEDIDRMFAGLRDELDSS